MLNQSTQIWDIYNYNKKSIYNTYKVFSTQNQRKNGLVCDHSAFFPSTPLPPHPGPAPPPPGVSYPDQLHLFACSRCHICPLHHTHGVELAKLWDSCRETENRPITRANTVHHTWLNWAKRDSCTEYLLIIHIITYLACRLFFPLLLHKRILQYFSPLFSFKNSKACYQKYFYVKLL